MSKKALNEAPSLFVDTLRQFTNLLEGELKLARAEVTSIASRAAVGIALIAIAFLLALVAANVLASAAVAYLAANGISIGLAALIIGGALLLVALGLALMGKARLSTDALTPGKTVDSIQTDIAAIKEAAHV